MKMLQMNSIYFLAEYCENSAEMAWDGFCGRNGLRCELPLSLQRVVRLSIYELG